MSPARLHHPWDSPGKNTGVGCHFLLQGIFPTQGSKPGLPHLQEDSLPAEPPGKPKNTGVGSLFLLQGIFPTQGLNPISGSFPNSSVVKNMPTIQETQEIWVQSLGQEDPLEQEMITHSSILAWEIPWTEEPAGLQSRGLQRLGHD